MLSILTKALTKCIALALFGEQGLRPNITHLLRRPQTRSRLWLPQSKNYRVKSELIYAIANLVIFEMIGKYLSDIKTAVIAVFNWIIDTGTYFAARN